MTDEPPTEETELPKPAHLREVAPADPVSRAAAINDAIDAEKAKTVTSRAEIAAAIAETQAVQDRKQDGDIALLGRINDRAYYLAELRHEIEQLERENEGRRMSVVAAIRANIQSRASADADALLLDAFARADDRRTVTR